LALLEGDPEDSDDIVDREAGALVLAEVLILARRGLRKWLARE
jgi:hypothetical protein